MTTVTGRALRTAAALLVAAAVVAPSSARADDSFVTGSGSAAASALQIGPKAGGLALTQLFGESLSGYIGTAAQAASQTIDMGLLGTLLSAKQCDGRNGILPPEDVPVPTRVDSRDSGADKGKTRTYSGTQDSNPLRVQAGREEAWAYKDPRAKSTMTLAVASLPGVIDMRGGVAQTEAGIVSGATRVAKASVDMGDVDLLGGAIKLSHLQWTAVQQTGKDPVARGSFSIGSVEIGGQSIPTNDPSAALAAVNMLTSQIGVTVEPPAMSQENGVVHVSPLVVHLQSSPTQQSVISPALVALQPARQAVISALTKITCYVQTGVTIGDVSIGPITGSGAFDLGFGGAAATTEGTRFDNPFAGGFGGGTAGVLGSGLTAPTSGSVPGALASGGVLGSAPAGVAGAPSSRTGRRGAAGGGLLAGARSLPGSTGGWAILVGFLAVAGVLGVAGADWWRMRGTNSGGEE